jgi:putative chitinase
MKNRKINFIKLGVLLFGISLFLFNCNQEEIEIHSQEKAIKKKDNFKTVSLAKAKAYMNNYEETKKTSLFARDNDFSFKPHWETVEQDSLIFTDALLTDLDIEANIELVEDTKLFFLEINDSIVSAIKTNIIRDRDENGNFKKGEIFFHSLEGNFIDAYTIVNGRLSKRLKPKPQIQQAGFLLFQSACAGDISLEQLIQFAIDNGGYFCFDEISITVSGGSSSSSGSGGPGSSGTSSTSSNSSSSEGTSGGGSSNNNESGNPDDDSLEAFADNNPPNCNSDQELVNDVCVPKCDENSTRNTAGECVCNDGFEKDNEGNCVTKCINGKVRNSTTNECECPNGKVEDANGNCVDNDDCNTSKEDLKKVFTNASDTTLSTLAHIINEKGKDFGINTKEKLQHFLAQAGHEVGEFSNGLSSTESLYYTTENRLKKIFRKYFWQNSTDTINKRNPADYIKNSSKVANYVYANRMTNGNEASGDGYKYRGRGIFQLTGKNNYNSFKTWYNNKYDPDKDFVTSPSLLTSNDTIAILSALWFYKTSVLDKITIDNNTTVKKVTKKVNGGKNGLTHRKEIFDKAKDSITCKDIVK